MTLIRKGISASFLNIVRVPKCQTMNQSSQLHGASGLRKPVNDQSKILACLSSLARMPVLFGRHPETMRLRSNTSRTYCTSTLTVLLKFISLIYWHIFLQNSIKKRPQKTLFIVFKVKKRSSLFYFLSFNINAIFFCSLGYKCPYVFNVILISL